MKAGGKNKLARELMKAYATEIRLIKSEPKYDDRVRRFGPIIAFADHVEIDVHVAYQPQSL